MNRKRAAFVIVIIVIVMVQFIRPERNANQQVTKADIARLYAIPDKVGSIFRNSCFDCHSNYTSYPWYANIQPIAWWMASHIKDGKSELNFSEFGSYSPRKQLSKLKSIKSSIKDNTMPLPSYTIVHRKARLSENEKEDIVDWITIIQDSLSRR